jgi:hypothetical protein
MSIFLKIAPPPLSQIRLGKKPFFVISEIFGFRFCGKKHVNYDKLEIATKTCKSNIEPKFILFLLFGISCLILP